VHVSDLLRSTLPIQQFRPIKILSLFGANWPYFWASPASFAVDLPELALKSTSPTNVREQEFAMSQPAELTQLLKQWRAGDDQALHSITPVVYKTLQQIAARFRSREAANLTLQATDIVHEAFVRLVDADVDWQDRAHFYAIAARTMRRVLVDHARSKFSDKRGKQYIKIPLDEKVDVAAPTNDLLLEFDEALSKLAAIDQRKGEVLELHVFSGLTYDEIGATLNISPATVDRDLRFAKAWIGKEIEQ